MKKTFKYVGKNNSIEMKGNTLHYGKPFETDNELLIAALEARASNQRDIKIITPKSA